MNSETPATNIMKTGDWGDAHSYRVACECHHPDHDVDVWIESKPDNETKDIEVIFYVDTQTELWKKGLNRFKIAFDVLFKGYHRSSHTIILNKQTASNLISAINQSIKDVQNFKKS